MAGPEGGGGMTVSERTKCSAVFPLFLLRTVSQMSYPGMVNPKAFFLLSNLVHFLSPLFASLKSSTNVFVGRFAGAAYSKGLTSGVEKIRSMK